MAMIKSNVLIIDIGNTRVKVSLVDQHDKLVDRLIFQSIDASEILKFVDSNRAGHDNIAGAIICSTRGDKLQIEQLRRVLRDKFDMVVLLDHTTKTPLINRYSTPATLGMDRLAAAVGANAIVPDTELLVVDLGTAITIDRVSRLSEFLGGIISPGMSMRFKALHTMTARLPLCTAGELSIDTYGDSIVGRDTHQAITMGVVRGIAYEIEGYVRESGCKTIFFTGGDAFYFADRVKCTIFANYDLVTIGLNRIFRHNAQIQQYEQHRLK